MCCTSVPGQPSTPAEQRQSLSDGAYKDGLLQKVAALLESHYVLADRAKGYADEFRAKCAAGSYDTFTEAKDFADKVTADLVAITRDKHLNFRVIVPSDVGEKAAGSQDSLFSIAVPAGLISEFFIDVFAYNFQSAPDEEMLFAVLAKNIEFFPDSPTAYERLAYVHDSKGNKDLALRYFRKALDLDPGNRNAAKMIKEIQNRN
ncbi:MAG: hypothetical protein A2W03_07030 [Candidatus Aminicenantes bacterium RBG_16_63_16]|nr:MAG: hypothetical protein A2W03_07030 [Candidatus Aminicenantes bacterium RBG_16_63_16]